MKIIDDGVQSAQFHMERDIALLSTLSEASSDTSLVWYEWRRSSITYGHFIDPARHLHLEKVAAHDIDMARRPTGGGLLFHMNDCVFTLAIPKGHPRYTDNVLENYRWVNEAVARAFGSTGELLITRPTEKNKVYDSYCMATPTMYDILFEGKKVGGSAQRKTRNGYIHQASLFLSEPNWDVIEDVVMNKEAVQMMRQNSGCIDHLSRQHLREALAKELSHAQKK